MSSSSENRIVYSWLKYYTIVNVIGFGLFAADKFRAKIGWYRISEKDLCIVSILGGWPAGLAAMFAFRHKLKKTPFIVKFSLATITNIALSYYILIKH